ncbi:hypothetical protein [Roseateles sp.]|uniref:hypothetical protein n=1 Tax=Roseateles sp. TaxID=1971397 RepID=UPI0039EAC95B
MSTLRPSLETATLRWMDACAHLSPATQNSYAGEVRRMTEYLSKAGLKDVADISEAHWHGYLAAVVGSRRGIDSKIRETLKTSSAMQAARITRAFFRHCWTNRWIDWVPCLGSYRCPPRVPDAPLEIPPELTSLLLDSGADDDEETSRSRCVIGLAFWGGFRPRMISALLRSDVSIDADGAARVTSDLLEHELVFPSHWASHLSRYDKLRIDHHGRLSNKSPLIGHLQSNLPISPTGVWRLLRSWNLGEEAAVHLGTRLIRASFQALATDGVSGLLHAVERQTATSRWTFPMRSNEAPTSQQLTASVLRRMKNSRSATGH